VFTGSTIAISPLSVVICHRSSYTVRGEGSRAVWFGGRKVICVPVALPASTSANTAAEGNQRFHLQTAYKKKKIVRQQIVTSLFDLV